ncbi:MAG: septum formation inhibitor Maf [Pseudomonadota bacterium]|nr:septum formation inhibitor Maf [Pseudomonadota bacterium]
MPPLLLASTSPRRRELLAQAGIAFALVPPGADGGVDETPLAGEDPAAYVARLACAKARAGVGEARRRGIAGPLLVLGADTTVAVDRELLGKPVDEADARRMLRLMSGRSHQVLTGLCLDDGSTPLDCVSISVVTFRSLTTQHIDDYLASREPFDKAGGYGIQGRAALLVKRIEGSYSGVMGLPLCELGELLERYQAPRGRP